jgi:toxin ParE1/3/4
MPGRYRVIISPRALSDLEDLHRYIVRDSPGNASALIRRLIAAIDSLEDFPHRNRVYQGRRQPSEAVRRMVVLPFLLYYRVDDAERVVGVITVRHGRRRQPRSFR